MPSWSCIKDDQVKVVIIERLHDLAKAGSLIDTWDCTHDLLQETKSNSSISTIFTFNTNALKEGIRVCNGLWINFLYFKDKQVWEMTAYQCVEVRVAFNLCWLACKFLIKSIGQVMCRIS